MSAIITGAPAFLVFVIFEVLLGAFAGLHYSVATVLLSRTFDEMGSAVSVHSLGAPLAGLVAPVAGTWVGVRYGWQFAITLTVPSQYRFSFFSLVRPGHRSPSPEPVATRRLLGTLGSTVGPAAFGRVHALFGYCRNVRA